MLTVGVARTGFARTGTFTTDNALLNRLQRNLEWAEQNNLVQKPTDTPSREKNGWTGDAMASSESAVPHLGRQRRLHQLAAPLPRRPDLHRPAPHVRPRRQGRLRLRPHPRLERRVEGGARLGLGVLRHAAGAVHLLRQQQPVRRAVRPPGHAPEVLRDAVHRRERLQVRSVARRLLRRGGPGSNAVISLAFYIHFCDYMDEVGRRLGRTERAAHYAKLARTLRRAFIANYWDAAKGHFTQGSISSENALAIAFDLVPGSDLSPSDPRYLAGTKTVAENKKALAKLLADRIVAADQHIQNDMYGSRYEFNILSEYGYTDIALKAVTQTGQPRATSTRSPRAPPRCGNSGPTGSRSTTTTAPTWPPGSTRAWPASSRPRPPTSRCASARTSPRPPSTVEVPKNTRGHRPGDRRPSTTSAPRSTPCAARCPRNGRRRTAGSTSRSGPVQHRGRDLGPHPGQARHRARGRDFRPGDTSGGAAYKVYRATAGSYRFNGGAR